MGKNKSLLVKVLGKALQASSKVIESTNTRPLGWGGESRMWFNASGRQCSRLEREAGPDYGGP